MKKETKNLRSKDIDNIFRRKWIPNKRDKYLLRKKNYEVKLDATDSVA